MSDQLTRNFYRHEFVAPEGSPTPVDWLLVEGLQQLRTLLGYPIYITCGYDPSHSNQQSYHKYGMAADIICYISDHEKMALPDLFRGALSVPQFRLGGIGTYAENFLHVDVRGSRARWHRNEKGIYVDPVEPFVTIEKRAFSE